jgi:hypothetical protein
MGPIGLIWCRSAPCAKNVARAVQTPQTHKSYRSYSSPTPACYLASAREPTFRLLLLKRPVHESSFQQPKNETNDRVDEELIEVDKKSGG